jgi:hypothetical protein
MAPHCVHLIDNPLPLKYYAAGFLEGVLTAPQIFDMYENLISTWPILKNGAPKNLSDFLSAQDAVGVKRGLVKALLVDVSHELGTGGETFPFPSSASHFSARLCSPSGCGRRSRPTRQTLTG